MRVTAPLAAIACLGLLACQPATLLSIVETPLPACADAGAPGFIDGTDTSGVDFVHQPADPDEIGVTLGISDFLREIGGGVLAADLDDDGATDLLFPEHGGPGALYWGAGDGTFTPGDGLPARSETDQSVSAADFDADGDLDVLILGIDSIALLRNDGDRTFTDVTAAFELVRPPGLHGGSSWADFDGDGDLDLFVAGHALEWDSDLGQFDAVADSLFRNDGDRFVDVVGDLPYAEGVGGPTLHAIWRDVDRDGDPDLLKFNDFGFFFLDGPFWENRGADGDGWSWVDRRAETIADLGAPMGAAIEDFDGDGLDDLITTDIGPPRAFRSDATWSWVDVSAAWLPGLPDTDRWVSWSVLAIDVAGSGRPSLLITYGPLALHPDEPDDTYGREPHQPDRLLQPEWDGDSFQGWTEDPDALPEQPLSNSRGAAETDLNGDGVPDLVIARIGEPPAVWLGRCTGAGRLVVDVRDPDGTNPSAIGAEVTVEVDGRVRRQTVEAGGRGSFSGQGPTLYFGTGAAAKVDRISVRWPDGRVGEATDVCAHCGLSIEPPEE